MPNRYQLAFLASLTLTFSFLVALLHFINARLIAAGYNISNLILIGLPNPKPAPMSSKPQDTFDFNDLAGSPLLAAVAAILLASVLYLTTTRKGQSKPLDPNEWKQYPLIKKTQISPNTAIYRLKLSSARDVLNLPIGQHIAVSAEINGKMISRNYTPISNGEDSGYFDLLIKTYEKGNISRHFAQLKIGDKIRVKGPKGNFVYNPDLTKVVSMIAGGTGITPMYQILRAALSNPDDHTKVNLIYANVNHEDILLKSELDKLAQDYESRFTLYYVLNNPPAGWKGGVGFVTKEHINQYLPNPAETESKLLICGPPPMVAAMKKNLDELKYPAPYTISKLDHKVHEILSA
ncbi:hypothetical protein AMATHDRAFT_134112 [Amanita thiersii Skay4041]|uniref:NADH-cytochrome b5 reductase n=1 Tax=Amanita thiersii Skay4041 TaxID=703135 RepID=A0A2A9NUI7_9AGAR|nr:hypothetical protein AMATHDRAFT_134112 [Amanita thiersii Skay4041]